MSSRVQLIRAFQLSATCVAAGLVLGGALVMATRAHADRGVTVNLVSNGGFETPRMAQTATWETVALGSRMGAWKVSAGSVDLIDKDYWKPAGGIQSLDLSGAEAGTIYQDIKTKPGARYRLTFALTANVDGGPTQKDLRVSFGPVSKTFHMTQTSTSRAEIRWHTVSRVFASTGPVTRLTFASLTPTAYGPVIDNVTVTRI